MTNRKILVKFQFTEMNRSPNGRCRWMLLAADDVVCCHWCCRRCWQKTDFINWKRLNQFRCTYMLCSSLFAMALTGTSEKGVPRHTHSVSRNASPIAHHIWLGTHRNANEQRSLFSRLKNIECKNHILEILVFASLNDRALWQNCWTKRFNIMSFSPLYK